MSDLKEAQFFLMECQLQPYLGDMSPLLRLRRRSRRPAAAEVNAATRRLMDDPSSTARTEEYVRLLTLWAEATADRARWDTAA